MGEDDVQRPVGLGIGREGHQRGEEGPMWPKLIAALVSALSRRTGARRWPALRRRRREARELTRGPVKTP